MRYAASEKLDIIRTVETSPVPNIIRNLVLAAPATHFVMLTQAVLVRGPAWVSCGRSFWRSSLLARRSSSSLSAASENLWMTLAVTISSAELLTPLDCSIANLVARLFKNVEHALITCCRSIPCRTAGISVKMITGDHAATAAAIARQLGLDQAPHVLTGADVDTMSDEELGRIVEEATVLARTSPEHKLRVVRALQAKGAVVAMTGDGVNDAPSIKQADVGIAMGHKGTEVAKEASEIVLLDDNFASIVSAVHEGRTVYDNIQKVTAWTLPTNGGEALTVIAAILLGFTMPMTPVQILWINMITTITLGLVLAFEPPEPNVMRRPPRAANAGLLSPFLVWRVVFVSLIFLAGALGIFFYALGRGLDVDTARTMVVNTIVVLEIFYLFNVRYLHMTSFTWRGALGTPAVLLAVGATIVAQLAFTYLPVMHTLFATKPVSMFDGLMIIAVGVVAMAILELEKQLIQPLGVLKLNS